MGVARLPETKDTASLSLQWAEAPWDTKIFDYPVLQITDMVIRGPEAATDFTTFEVARDAMGTGLVSCRLPHDRLRESMLLEERGFRFIEMAYQPEIELDDCTPSDDSLTILQGTQQDMPEVLDIAGTAFRNERFHVDPRLDPSLGDRRYCNWVQSTLDHPRQRLFVLKDGAKMVSFFVTEQLEDGTRYWHLNAISPKAQGKGYGKRAWKAMMAQAKREGASRIQTCIVARNYRVLNLYARLGFRFPPPLMTFHWLKPQ